MTATRRPRVFLSEEEAAPIREMFRNAQENWLALERAWPALMRDHQREWDYWPRIISRYRASVSGEGSAPSSSSSRLRVSS